MSYKIEVHIKSEGSWTGNAIRYETEEEAQTAGRDLLSRWWVPDTFRVVESEEPVNYVIWEGRTFNIEKAREIALLFDPYPVDLWDEIIPGEIDCNYWTNDEGVKFATIYLVKNGSALTNGPSRDISGILLGKEASPCSI